jgi:hypothetical protein
VRNLLERSNYLFTVVVDDTKVTLAEAADGATIVVNDNYIDLNKLHLRAKAR